MDHKKNRNLQSSAKLTNGSINIQEDDDDMGDSYPIKKDLLNEFNKVSNNPDNDSC